MTVDHVRARVLVVVVVDRLAPVARILAAQERGQAAALHLLGWRDAGDVEEGLGEVDVLYEVLVDGTGLGRSGPAYEQRHAQRLLVHPALVVPAVIAEIEALVGVVDDDGVLGEAGLVEIVEHAAEVLVDGSDAAEVVLDVALVAPADEILAGEVRLAESGVLRLVGGVPDLELFGGEVARGLQLRVRFGEVVRQSHLLHPACAGASLPVVEERRRLGQVDVVEVVEVLRPRLPVAVRRLVLEHQHEGPVGVALFPQPLQGQIGEDVGGVADHLLGPLFALQRWVVVGALTLQHSPEVESGRIALEVPLADHRRLVARFAEQLGEGDLLAVELDRIVDHAILMAMLAGENRRPTRRADRVTDEAVLEEHPFVRESIDVRRLVEHRAVGADRVRRVVVGEDEEDVRTRGLLSRRGLLGGPWRSGPLAGESDGEKGETGREGDLHSVTISTVRRRVQDCRSTHGILLSS